MFEHRLTYRIPYSDVDRMNIVHHANYAKYYELGRTEAIRAAGWSYQEMEENGISMAVVELKTKFIRSARYDDVIEIVTMIKELPKRTMQFYTEIYDQDETLLNLGEIKFLFLHQKTLKIISAPNRLNQLLMPYFNK